MSDPHLEFDRDVIPTAERDNPLTHTDFDWETIFANMDGELEGLRQDLGDDDFRKLEEALTLIFCWVLNSRDNANHGLDAAVGRRFLTLALVLTPNLVGRKRHELTREFGISRQRMCDAVKDARKFLRKLRV